MRTRDRIRRLCLFTLAAAAAAAAPSAAAPKPNVILILADDLGYGDVGCYGATKVRTPNIDRLAKEGRRFTDAHAASSVCSPSRYALLTGRYPFRVGNLWGPLGLRSPLVVETSRLTLARVMKDAGYATACLGKWHLGFGRKAPVDWNRPLRPGPLELGFDYYFGIPVVSSGPPFVYVENDRVVGWTADDPFVYGQRADTRAFPEKMGLDQIGGARAAHKLYDEEEVGTTLKTKAVEWIGQHHDAPFFLYLATPAIHHPFTPAPQFRGTSECGRYGDSIHELDWVVGEVLAALEKHGLADQTLVIFTSDNGGMLNQGGQDAWKAGHRLNGDLFGFKFDAWEGGHRVPFIVRWPGHVPAGTTSDQLVGHVDLLATMAALVGRALGPDDGPDSFNLLPAFTGSPEQPIRDHMVFCPSLPENIALRDGRWVYISARGGGGFAGQKIGEHLLGGPAATRFTREINSDIIDGRLRPDAPPAQLYDVAADRCEAKNVYRENPEVAARLKARLEALRAADRTAPR
jgi:arylsulfatase A